MEKLLQKNTDWLQPFGWMLADGTGYRVLHPIPDVKPSDSLLPGGLEKPPMPADFWKKRPTIVSIKWDEKSFLRAIRPDYEEDRVAFEASLARMTAEGGAQFDAEDEKAFSSRLLAEEEKDEADTFAALDEFEEEEDEHGQNEDD